MTERNEYRVRLAILILAAAEFGAATARGQWVWVGLWTILLLGNAIAYLRDVLQMLGLIDQFVTLAEELKKAPTAPKAGVR